MPTLNWLGKDKVVNHHQDVQYRVLERSYTYSTADTGNMIIHGDNLDALKSLLPQYEGLIKCIYIDPPYNTGNEGWVYNDNVNDPRIKKWLGEVVGKEGEDLSRHDKWLCMMYPRLKLLQRLLAPDGAIFISIDDNEQANLKLICEEIFGRNKFLTQFSWRTDGNFDNQAKVKICHEYILCYLKNPDILGLPNGVDPSIPENSKIFRPEIRNTLVKNGYKNPMSVVTLPVGFPCAVSELIIEERTDSFPHYHNTAHIKNNRLSNETNVESGWSSKELLLEYIKGNCSDIFDSKGQRTRFEISKTGAIEMIKIRSSPSHVISTLSNLGSTQNMSSELKKMEITFDYPKPTKLLEYILEFYSEENSIILDSFAGTGVTAHAVLNMNKQDGGNRKFILIEMMDYAESITAERVRRVIDGYADKDGTGGGFEYYELGEPLMFEDGNLNEAVGVEKIREYVWYTETKEAYIPTDTPYYLGTKSDTAYYFYYEPDAVTTLDVDFLKKLNNTMERHIIYADMCALSDADLARFIITFKKIPRDISKL